MIFPPIVHNHALMESIKIFQSFVNIRTVNDFIERLAESFTSRSSKTFFYLNTYSSYLCDVDPGFRKAFNAADYIITDGTSIVFALKHLHGVPAEKVTVNHTFFDRMAAFFNDGKVSLFLFGSTDETLGKAKANLQRQYPGMVIAGTHHGYLADQDESDRVVSLINAAKPQVLFVGMGMPLSELWIDRNRHRLDVSCIITVGNLFDIIAGDRSMAPGWLVNTGLEWVFRLFQEPRRLAPRYIKANSRYLLDMISGFRARHRK